MLLNICMLCICLFSDNCFVIEVFRLVMMLFIVLWFLFMFCWLFFIKVIFFVNICFSCCWLFVRCLMLVLIVFKFVLFRVLKRKESIFFMIGIIVLVFLWCIKWILCIFCFKYFLFSLKLFILIENCFFIW